MPVRTTTPQIAEAGSEFGMRERTAMRSALMGKLNCVGDFELAVAPATTTDLTDPLITADTLVIWKPTNALALAEPAMQHPTFVAPNTARFTHTSNAGARTFRYGLIG